MTHPKFSFILQQTIVKSIVRNCRGIQRHLSDELLGKRIISVAILHLLDPLGNYYKNSISFLRGVHSPAKGICYPIL
jgi:hypothetical protein